MNSLERVRAALALQRPDRTPRLLYDELIGYVPAVRQMLAERCGGQAPRDYFRMDMTAVERGPTRLPKERFREWLPAALADAADPPIDEWGVWWRPGSFLHYAHIESPLAAVDDFARIQRFPWPDVDADYRYEGMARAVADWHAAGLAVAAFAGSVFEQAWYLRGMEGLLTDMLVQPEVAHYLLDRAAELQRASARAMAAAGVDMVILGDDVAQQQGLLMRASTWREFLAPRLAATCRAAHDAAGGVKVFYHSDGNIEPLVGELIAAGVDVLNPVQPECVDPAALKARFGDRLAFFGSVSVQNTLPRGTPADVRAEVRARIRTVGYNGGLVLAPAHVLGPDVPWENVVAFFEAADECG